MGRRDFDGILSPKKLGVWKMRMLIFQAPVGGFYELHTLILKLALRIVDEFSDRKLQSLDINVWVDWIPVKESNLTTTMDEGSEEQ